MDLDQSDVNSSLAISLFIDRKYSTKGVPRLSSADRALIIIPDEIKEILVVLGRILLGGGLIFLVVFIILLFFNEDVDNCLGF